jgi:hypothetical protein
MRLSTLTLIMLVAAPLSAHGQDFLQDFERFVEDVLPERESPATGGVSEPVRPTPPIVARPVAPTTPTPTSERPDAAEDEATDGPPLPRPRPETPVEAEEPPEAEAPVEETEKAEETEPAEPRPAEPARIYQTACPALLSGLVQGEMLEPIEEGMCGERSPLLINAVMVNGRAVTLSSPVTTNCEMAGALADWAGEVDAYAKAALESPLVTLNTGTSMMCRNRYSAENGFVSEHGFANAIDLTGFVLEDGRTINVEADWLPAASMEGRLLRQAHGAACGRFTTVLGPEANAEHEDHFHLDLGCHGQSCTAQICE